MPGGGDGWEDEFGEDDETKADPVPVEIQQGDVLAPVPSEVTGKYPTLPGYEVARETVERIAVARGRTTERTFMLASLRFFLISRGGHVDGIDSLVSSLHEWVQRPENERLVRTALGWDKNPP